MPNERKQLPGVLRSLRNCSTSQIYGDAPLDIVSALDPLVRPDLIELPV